LGARRGHLGENVLFMFGIALDRVDQVGHQVGATLVLVEHFRPGGLDRLVAGLEGVVAAAREQDGDQGQQREDTDAHEQILHREMKGNTQSGDVCANLKRRP